MSDFKARIEGRDVFLEGQDGKVLATLFITPACPEHRNFILSTWLKSYEKQSRTNHWAGLVMKPETFRSGEARVAEKFWERACVVVSEDDQYTIHGWVCFKDSTLLHVYVPPQLRDSGLSRELVHNYLGTTYHSTKPMTGWVAMTDKVTFNPYVVMGDA